MSDHVSHAAVHSARLLAHIRVARREMEAARKPAGRVQVRQEEISVFYVQPSVGRL